MADANLFYRHTRATRVLHWINALCVFLMLMSGLQIFGAHPRLYWGKFGADADPAALEIGAHETPQGPSTGFLRIGNLEFHTSGFLGLSASTSGQPTEKAFPGWATIPSDEDLSGGRRWHFFFAWVLVFNSLVYFAVGFATRHITRDLLPARAELAPRHIVHELWDHLRLRFPRGEAAKRYNSLQKLAYVGMIFGVAPLLLATGLTMSPGADAACPWLLDLFGGRQSARTLHFISAMLVVLFIAVHLAMIVLAGPFNELRSMITGRFVIPAEKRR